MKMNHRQAFKKSKKHRYKLTCFSKRLCKTISSDKTLNRKGIYFIYSDDELVIGNKPKNSFLNDVVYPTKFLVNKIPKKGDILYIGQTKRPMKKRAKELYKSLFERTNTENCKHLGGHALSQISNYDSLIISFYADIRKNKPKDLEKQFLFEYSKKNGKLPFANMDF